LPELERLSELWEQASGGSRQIAFIGGEPGVGKTRLATEFAQRAHGHGGGVLYGRADEQGTVAFQPFVEALRHWAINTGADEVEGHLRPYASVLARLVPEISIRLEDAPAAEPDVGRDRLLDAVTGTLA